MKKYLFLPLVLANIASFASDGVKVINGDVHFPEGMTLTDERDIETYRAAFVSLREFAVMGDEVTALIRAIMADLLHLR